LVFLVTKEASVTFFTLVLLVSTWYHIRKTKQQATEQKTTDKSF
jgi:hypothetical protein